MLFRLAFAIVSATALLIDPIGALSQDLLAGVDLNSPEMSTPEMTRADVDALLMATRRDGVDRPANLQAKRLSQLDLSGLDFSGSNLRLAKLNRSKLKGARLDRTVLNQAWLIEADLTGGVTCKGNSARHADATCQTRRRRSERRAHSCRSFRRQPRRGQSYGRRFQC